MRRRMLVIVLLVGSWAGIERLDWVVARYALAASPVADSLGTWASLFATWLLARYRACVAGN